MKANYNSHTSLDDEDENRPRRAKPHADGAVLHTAPDAQMLYMSFTGTCKHRLATLQDQVTGKKNNGGCIQQLPGQLTKETSQARLSPHWRRLTAVIILLFVV